MKFSKEIKQLIDQHIRLIVTDVTGQQVDFDTLHFHEKLAELSNTASQVVHACNEQIESDNDYMVTSEMLDQVDELEFMMDRIMLDVAEFRSDLNHRESFNG